MGVEKLHSYLGFAAFFAGIAAMGGPPLAGKGCYLKHTHPRNPGIKHAAASLSYRDPSQHGFSVQTEREKKNPISEMYFYRQATFCLGMCKTQPAAWEMLPGISGNAVKPQEHSSALTTAG